MSQATPKYPNRLREQIKRLGYTNREVAAETNIPPRSLTDYCTGRVPIPRERLEAIARVVGCSAGELLVVTKPNQEPTQIVETTKATPEPLILTEDEGRQEPLPLLSQAITQGIIGAVQELRRLDKAHEYSPLVRLTPEQIVVLQSLPGNETLMLHFDPAKRETLRTLREWLAVTGITIASSPLINPEQLEQLERLAGSFKKPSRMDTKTLSGLKMVATNYWQLRVHGSIASPDLLSLAKEHYRVVTQLLQGSLFPTTRASLCAVASETALLVGMLLSTDMHKYDEAWSHYSTALAMVEQANNDVLYAAVLGRMGALAATTGKPKVASSLLQDAQRSLTQNDSFTLRAWLAAEEAEVQAGFAA